METPRGEQESRIRLVILGAALTFGAALVLTQYPSVWAWVGLLIPAAVVHYLHGRLVALERTVAEQRDRLAQAQEQTAHARAHERFAVAREVHDVLGQEITAVRYALATAQQQVGAAPDIFEPIDQALARVTHSVRGLAQRGGSPVASTPALLAGLRTVLARARTSGGLDTALDASADALGTLPDPVRLSILRIVQEATTNVLKHARASRLQVCLRRTAGQVRLQVADDGVGLRSGWVLGGLGVVGITRRAAELGGQARWTRGARGGTRLEVRLPAVPSGSRVQEHVFQGPAGAGERLKRALVEVFDQPALVEEHHPGA